METSLECQASGSGTVQGQGGSEKPPQGLGGSPWPLQKPKEGGAASCCAAELVHVMPNLSHPLKSDNKLIFFRAWNEDLACFGGGEEMLWAAVCTQGVLVLCLLVMLFINWHLCGTWRGAELGGLVQGMIPDAPMSPGLDPGWDEQGGVELGSGFPFKSKASQKDLPFLVKKWLKHN